VNSNYTLVGCDLFNVCVYVVCLECTYGLHKDVEGFLGMAVGRVGLLSLLYCILLPAGVDGRNNDHPHHKERKNAKHIRKLTHI